MHTVGEVQVVLHFVGGIIKVFSELGCTSSELPLDWLLGLTALVAVLVVFVALAILTAPAAVAA